MSAETLFSLLGGIGLFLYGMTVMSSGLRNACGDNLQGILEKATSNKYMAVLVGLAVTVLIQSSSATDIMVIGFVNSGMMSLSQAIGVIMGANIGTTVTAQITAFNISAYAPVILFLGAVMFLFLKQSRLKYIGEFLMGFGMLFVGISIMKSSIAPLADSQGFIRILSELDNPFLAVLFGVAFTSLLQSSSSSTVIFQTFAMQGLLGYHTAVYLVIGAAIGSVTPNIIASLTTNRNGKRTAILNLLFNLIRAAILIILINIFPGILDLIQSISPGSIGRQVANTHTIFAIFAVLVELPLTEKIIRVAEKLIPVLPEENEQLEDRSLKFMINMRNMPTAVALSQAHLEVARMGRIAEKNLRKAVDCFFDYSAEKSESVKNREESVDLLQKAIDEALVDLRTLELSGESLKKISKISTAVADMERLSDHAENIVEYADELHSKRIHMGEEAVSELRNMSSCSLNIVAMSLNIFGTGDFSDLDLVNETEDKVDDLQVELMDSHTRRLMNGECSAVESIIYTNLVNDLERVADHAVNIAYALTDRDPDDAEN